LFFGWFAADKKDDKFYPPRGTNYEFQMRTNMNIPLFRRCSFRFRNFAAELFLFNFTRVPDGVTNKQTKNKGMTMYYSCIDPPKRRNPGSRPGFQNESSLDNPNGFPEGNSINIIVGNITEVKPRPHRVVDNGHLYTTCGVKTDCEVSPEQLELLNRLSSNNHQFGLLLALHGDLRPEHSVEENFHDSWDEELLRRADRSLRQPTDKSLP
jgi:hypothetical protein